MSVHQGMRLDGSHIVGNSDNPIQRSLQQGDLRALDIGTAGMLNLFCDGYSSKSLLQGDSLAHSLGYTVELLRHVQSTYGIDIPDELIQRYEVCHGFARDIEGSFREKYDSNAADAVRGIGRDMGRAAQHLAQGETLTLPLGIVSSDQKHAMLLDIKRNHGNTFDLVIYNTGAGLQYHESFQTKDKKLSLVQLTFKDIPYNELFFASPDEEPAFLFFESLVFAHIFKQNKNFTVDFLYQNNFRKFWKYLDRTQRPMKDFRKPQGDGNCPWKVVMKHLSYQVPEDIYKRIRFFIDHDLVEANFQKGRGQNDVVAQSVLTIATEKLHARIDSCLRLGVISEEEARHAQKRATDIQHEVKTYNPKREEVASLEDPLGLIDEPFTERLKGTLRYLQKDVGESRGSFVPGSLDSEIACNPKEFSLGLYQVRDAIKRCSQEEKVYTIDHFVEKIPVLDETFWKQVNAGQYNECLEYTVELLETYLDNTIHAEGFISGRQVDTLLVLYATADRLARLKDQTYDPKVRILHQFNGFNPFQTLDMEPFFQLAHERDTRRLQDVRDYFAQGKRRTTLPRLDDLTKLSQHNLTTHPLAYFYFLVQEKYPGVKETCASLYKDAASDSSFNAPMRRAYRETAEKTSESFVNTHILIAQQVNALERHTHLKKWIQANWNMQCLLNDGPTINRWGEKTFSPSKFTYASSRDSFAYQYNDWKQSDRYQGGFHCPNPKLRSFLSEALHQRVLLTDDISPHEADSLTLHQTDHLSKKWQEREIYWAASERRLQPFHLLAHYTTHIDELQEEYHQSILDLQFFKTLIIQNSHNATENLVIDDLALLDAISQFVEKGMLNYYEMQPEKKPVLPICLFFMRFIQKSRGCLNTPADHPKTRRFLELEEKMSQLLLSWIESPDFSNSEKSLMHLHRMHRIECLNLPDWPSEAIGDVLGSWAHYKSHPIDTDSRLPFFQYRMSGFARNLVNHLREIEWDPTLVGQAVCKALGDGKHLHTKWRKKGNYYLVDDRGLGLAIDLFNGKTYYKGSERLLSVPDDLFNSAQYFQLFGKERFNFYKDNEAGMDYDYFDHPDLGRFRVGRTHWNGFVIQHYVEDRREWFQFVDRKRLWSKLKGEFPFPLVANHHHFLSTSSKNLELCIMNKEMGRVATVDHTGVIRDQSMHQLIRPGDVELPSLFDEPKYHLVRRHHNGAKIDWEIPRFRSARGNALKFTYDGEGWGWSENSRFYLTGKKNAYLGAIPNYYHLKHRDTGEEKVLVPFKVIDPMSTQSFDPQGNLLVSNPMQAILLREEESYDEMETFSYFTFRVTEDGSLATDRVEGALFLAYLELHQGNYDSFLEQFTHLSLIDNLSEEGFKILDLIIDYTKLYPNAFPNAHALILRTALRESEHLLKKDTSTKFSSMGKRLENNYRRYLQYLNHINEKYLLSPQEELRILSYFDKDMFVERRAFLSKAPTVRYTHTPGIEPSPHTYSPYHLFHEYVDLDYRGGQTFVADAHMHLASFNIDQAFFREAWDTIRSDDRMAKSRLVYRLQMMEGLEKMDESSQFRSGLSSSRIQFYQYCAHLPAGTFFPLPCDYQGEVDGRRKYPREVIDDWITAIRGRYWVSEANIDSRTKQQVPPLPLPQNGLAAISEGQKLSLRQLPYQDTFTDVLKLFHSAPLVKKGCHVELDGVWKFEVPEHLRQYEGPIKEEIRHTQETIEAGRKHLESLLVYTLPVESVDECIALVTTKIEKEKDELQELKKFILKQANQVPDEELLPLLLRQGANRTNSIDMATLCRFFLHRSRDEFRQANPHLSQQDIEELFDLLGAWNYHMVLHNLAVAELKNLKKIQKIDQGGGNPLARKHLCQKVATELLKEPKFARDMSPEALTFSRMTHRIPRADQMSDIRHFYEEENCILQKIMGGGKTSVDAAMWASLTAAKGKLPVFVAHNSQKSQVKENLKKSQKTAFGQDVFTIDYMREELTLERLKYILDQLNEGLDQKKLLIICPEMLDVLDLQCDLLLKRLLNLEGEDLPVEEDKHAFEKIQVIHEIMEFFKKHTDGLGDEVDLLLNNYQETNVPIGKLMHVPAARVELSRKIFELCIYNEKDVLIEGQTIRDYIGIMINRQTSLPSPDYTTKVLPVLAKLLAQSHFPSLEDRPDLHASFVRFVQKTMDPKIDKVRLGLINAELNAEEQKDLEFMKLIHELYESPNAAKKEEANLITLSKHLFSDLIPTAFKLSAGRNFGRWRDQGQSLKTPFKIVPFLGVDTPALTEFGWHYEAIVKHFLTALSFDIDSPQLQMVADKMLLAAHQQKRHEGVKLEETAEALAFQAMTGENIETMNDSDSIKRATKLVNSDPLNKLMLEGETAAIYASYYAARLTRRPQGLNSYFSKLNFMGGTTWNSDGYNRCYTDSDEHLYLDKAAVGSILQMIFNKRPQVHIPESMELESIFEVIYEKHPDNFLQGIFDSGAIFSHHKSKDIAIAFMNFAKKKELNFQGATFFDTVNGAGNSDQFSSVINGFTTAIPIHGTQAQDIHDATNFGLEELFVYLSEKQTTGTDLPFPPDATAVWTVDEGMLLRTALQTVLRLRQFFHDQNAEPLVPAYMIRNLAMKTGTLEDIIATGILNQGVKKANSLDRSYHNMIDQVFEDKKSALRREILSKHLNQKETLDALAPIYGLFDPFIQIRTVDEPFLHFAGLEEDVDYIDYLHSYAARAEKRFKDQLHRMRVQFDGNQPILRCLDELDRYFHYVMKKEVHELVERAKNKHRSKLPATGKQVQYVDPKADDEVRAAPSAAEIHQERQVERQVENKHELNQELQLELEGYSTPEAPKAIPEPVWKDEEIFELLRNLQDDTPTNDRILTLNASFKECKRYRKERDFAFWDDNILVTDHYRRVGEALLPVFHKSQRPARHIFCYHNPEKAPRFLLLSAKEAVAFKIFLEKYYMSNQEDLKHFSLLHSNKSEFVPNPHNTVIQSVNFISGIVQINLFDGSVSSIDSLDFATAEQWLMTGNVKEKQDYLRMRVERRPIERTAFYQSTLYHEVEGGVHKYESLARMRAQTYLTNPTEIPKVEDKKLIYRFKQPQMKYITKEQVPFINPRMIPFLEAQELIQAVPTKNVHMLMPNQMKYISTNQLICVTEEDRIQRLPEHLLKVLDFTGQPDDQVRSFLSKLTTHQIGYLRNPKLAPFIAKANLKFIHASLVPGVPFEDYNLLPPGHLEHLSGENLASIEKEEDLISLLKKCNSLVQKLPTALFAKLWNKVRDDEEAPLYTPLSTQLSQITDPDLINHLVNPDLNLIHPEIVNHIPEPRLLALTNKGHIQALTPEKIQHIADDQLEKISLTQLSSIIETTYPRLTHPKRMTLIAKFKTEDIPPQSMHQLCVCPVEEFKQAAQEALKSYKNHEIIPLLTNESTLLNKLHGLANQIPTACYGEITKEIITKLERDKFEFLKADQMEHLTQLQVGTIEDGEVIIKLPVSKVPFVSERPLGGLTPQRIRRIVHAELIHRLPILQLNHLDNPQLQHISQLQLGQIRDLALLARLLPAQIPHTNAMDILPVTQYPHLSNIQIPDVPVNRIQHLSNGQLEHLSPAQVQQMRNGEDLLRLPLALIEHVSAEALANLAPQFVARLQHDAFIQRLPTQQFTHLTVDQLDHLSVAQVQQMRNGEDLLRLPLVLIEHVSAEALANLAPQFVARLQHDAFIQRLPTQQFTHLTVDQLDHLSVAQVHRIQSIALLQRFHRPKLRDLSQQQLSAIRDRTLLERLYPNQIPFTNALQVLPDAQFKYLGAQQIPEVQVTKLHLLTADQLEHATTRQLHSVLDVSVITKLRDDHVRSLDFVQLIHIDPHQLHYATMMQKVAYVVSTIVLGVISAIVQLTIYLYKKLAEMQGLQEHVEKADNLYATFDPYVNRIHNLGLHAVQQVQVAATAA